MYVATKTGNPVRYVMKGYDTLLGSHYDKYYLDYKNYHNTKIPDKTWEVNKSMEYYH